MGNSDKDDTQIAHLLEMMAILEMQGRLKLAMLRHMLTNRTEEYFKHYVIKPVTNIAYNSIGQAILEI